MRNTTIFVHKISPVLWHRAGSAYGATLVEYVLLLALIALMCIGALQVVGRGLSEQFSTIASNIPT